MMSYETVINAFDTISLHDIKEKQDLLTRVDVKYLLNSNDLGCILEELQDEYRILEINNQRIIPYSTLYYDTNNCKFYHDHHNQKKDRYKVRIRLYGGTNDCFLEVKHKTNKGETIKKRQVYGGMQPKKITAKGRSFLTGRLPVNPNKLLPMIKTDFSRITLSNKIKKERVTIDTKLTFNKDNHKIKLPELVIIEVKKETHSNNYCLFQIAKRHNIIQHAFSKYCIGSLLMNDHLKYNNFKKHFLLLNKIANDKFVINRNSVFRNPANQ